VNKRLPRLLELLDWLYGNGFITTKQYVNMRTKVTVGAIEHNEDTIDPVSEARHEAYDLIAYALLRWVIKSPGSCDALLIRTGLEALCALEIDTGGLWARAEVRWLKTLGKFLFCYAVLIQPDGTILERTFKISTSTKSMRDKLTKWTKKAAITYCLNGVALAFDSERRALRLDLYHSRPFALLAPYDSVPQYLWPEKPIIL